MIGQNEPTVAWDDPRVRKLEEEHRDAVDEVESLFGSEPGTPGYDRAHFLVDMIEEYERGVFTVPPASLEARAAFRQEQMSIGEQLAV